MNRAAPPTLLPLETFLSDKDVFCWVFAHRKRKQSVCVRLQPELKDKWHNIIKTCEILTGNWSCFHLSWWKHFTCRTPAAPSHFGVLTFLHNINFCRLVNWGKRKLDRNEMEIKMLWSAEVEQKPVESFLKITRLFINYLLENSRILLLLNHVNLEVIIVVILG